MLGKLTSSIQAVFPAPLHFRHIQASKNAAIREGLSYEDQIVLPQEALEELRWWQDHLFAWSGKALLQKNPDLVIETDASHTGWGAYCNGIQTGGRWSESERLLHSQSLRQRKGKNPGPTVDGQHHSIDLCKQDGRYKIFNLGQYGPPTRAVVFEPQHYYQSSAYSRKPECDSRLRVQSHAGLKRLETRPSSLQSLMSKWGPLEIDLFASRLNRQLAAFFSWRPDPEAKEVMLFLHLH